MNKKQQLDDLLNRPVEEQATTSDRRRAFSSERRAGSLEDTRMEATPKFTFRDIEDSLETFDGSNDVETWIQEFEETADIFKWGDLEKLVYGRRLLKNIPRKYVNSELKPRTWTSLRNGLIDEFKKEINSALVHILLETASKSEDETCNEFFYRMTDIAAPIRLEAKGLMTYIIDGLEDNESNKLILHQAKSVKELKEILKTYEEVKKSQRTRLTRNTPKESTSLEITKSKLKEYKCYNCGQLGHRSFEAKCPQHSSNNEKASQILLASINSDIQELKEFQEQDDE